MRAVKLIVIIVVALYSCDNYKPKENTSTFADSGNSKQNILIDSIDVDTSVFITSHFPDIVRQTLHGSNDSGWMSVSAFYMSIKNRSIAIDSFKKVMTDSHFNIDTVDNTTRFWKKTFNRRFGVELRGDSIDTISLINQFWHLGKKYELVTRKYKSWKGKTNA